MEHRLGFKHEHYLGNAKLSPATSAVVDLQLQIAHLPKNLSPKSEPLDAAVRIARSLAERNLY